jgi:hypothetical protein
MTSVAANGAITVSEAKPATDPPIDCFYVYPTVSEEKGPNANLAIQPQETGVAIAQASWFSRVCRVFAPMYPQATIRAIDGGSVTADVARAYPTVLAAWQYYLQHYNDGRGFVLIGHSQGSDILNKLIQQEIDPNATLRARLVSALILGGNVLVRRGERTGGYFQHLPTCDSASETGCVVAYSSFLDPPPPDSRFGRAEEGGGVIIANRPPAGTPLQVACVNPAQLLGQAGDTLESYFPTSSSPAEKALFWWPAFVERATPWVTYPGLYSARCMNAGGAQWLQITVHQGSVVRPTVQQPIGPSWGLHLDDINLSIGDLIQLVQRETAAYTAH